jgi:Asp-tRNA(Asn)/Glu-tRNA(Gln) amidotransferase A subunit family amidase
VAGLTLLTNVAFGSAFIGPNNEPYQIQDNGYNPNIIDLLPIGPKNLAEEYRRVTPVMYYTFDQNFIDYFGTNGIDAIMKSERRDALLFPAGSGAAISAKPGYPTVLVPFGMVANAPSPAFPTGFDAKRAPFGVSFAGMSCSEPRLIELAYAFEHATKRRVPPGSTP